MSAFAGTILHISVETNDTGLMVYSFKLLPENERVPSNDAYHQSESEEKTKGSLRPLTEAEA
jgi:hypothetical protein